MISVGGEDERLGVWTRGNVGTKGCGAYENVRVARADVLREFPAEAAEDEDVEPAGVSDEQVREVVRAAMASMGGFIGQAEGASVVRREFPDVTRDRARKLVRQIIGNEKPGPKGPRRSDVVINILARQRDPGPVAPVFTPDALRLRHAPVADCARYDQLRRA